jgi:hypothetical protein
MLALLFAAFLQNLQDPPKPELVDVRKIWDQAPHNAFTDLIRFKDRWLCVFREGKTHISPDGALRVISSADGQAWASEALVTLAGADLRDAKITLAPDGRLMLSGAAAYPAPAETRHQSLTWFSSDGKTWTEAAKVADPNFWLWRVSWHRGRAYGIGYSTVGAESVRLFSSTDGLAFDTPVKTLLDQNGPNEGSILFSEDDTALCLLRRDGGTKTAVLGSAKPPYQDWTWKDLGIRIGGPHLLRLPDGRIVAGGRLFEKGVRTSLVWLDPVAGTVSEFLKLPSGGDTSYPGFVWHDGLLWVSYYSTHEGKTAIYLARVKIPPAK